MILISYTTFTPYMLHHICSTGQLPSLMFRKSTLRSLKKTCATCIIEKENMWNKPILAQAATDSSNPPAPSAPLLAWREDNTVLKDEINRNLHRGLAMETKTDL